MSVRTATIDLEYQNYIENPPLAPQSLYNQACSNDTITIDTWRKIWLDNTAANKKRFGSFKDHSLGKLYGLHKYKPAIVVGSGPSLKHNASELLKKGEIPIVSCLHNFHFLEDLGVDVELYVTLDAGPVVIEEVYEGGAKTPEEYWARSKGKKLAAFIGTDPKLFDLWQGEILFFNAPIPDANLIEAIDSIEKFHLYVSNGGNVLGACMYIAKAIFGCNPIAYIGADFSFSYDKKFHGWKSKYDAKLGHVMRAIDIFGNKVLTWPSYNNFKAWFDYICLTVNGIWVNCTEGGTLGAYADGNLMAIRQQKLADFIRMYHLCEEIEAQCRNSEIEERRLLF